MRLTIILPHSFVSCIHTYSPNISSPSHLDKEREIFENIIKQGRAIQHPLLRVIGFRHTREITPSWINSEFYHRFKKRMFIALYELPPNFISFGATLIRPFFCKNTVMNFKFQKHASH